MPNTYNVGWLRDEENQIFIPFTYTKSVKLNDNGNTLNETVEMVDKHDAKISEIISGTQVTGVANLANATKGQLKVGNVTFNGSENKEITAKDLGLTGALVYQGISTSKITDGGTQNPTIDNITISTDNIEPGGIVLYKASDSKIYQEFVWTGTTWELLGDEGSYALKSIVINPGNGLSGGGDLSGNVGIEVSADGITITAESGTVAMVKAAKNTGTFGPTANISSLDPSGTTKSFTVPSIKVDEYGRVIEASTKIITLVTDTTVDNELEKLNNRKITAGAGLTGTGTLANDITLNVGKGTGIVVNADNIALEASGVTSGTYGESGDKQVNFDETIKIPNIQVDTYGRVIKADDTEVKMPSITAFDQAIADIIADIEQPYNKDAGVHGIVPRLGTLEERTQYLYAGDENAASFSIVDTQGDIAMTVNADGTRSLDFYIGNQTDSIDKQLNDIRDKDDAQDTNISNIASVTVVSGKGLTGNNQTIGTTENKQITLNVGAGTGIVVNDNDVALATSGVHSNNTAQAYGPSANADPEFNGTFSVPYIKVDKYGRVTEASTKTITMPDNSALNSNIETLTNRKITAGDGLDINNVDEATLAADITLKVNTGNGVTITDDKVSLEEISGLTVKSYGQSANDSPNFEGSFTVPYITVDKYGRITAIANKTVTMPSKDALDKSIEDLTNRKIVAGNGLSEANSKETLAQNLTFNVNVGAGLKIDNNDKVAHSNSVTAGTAQGSSGELTFDTTFNIPTVTYDSQGHITGSGTTSIKMPSIDSFNNGIANNTEQIANIIANIQGDENKAVDWNWNTNPRISALENRTKYMDASVDDNSFKIVDAEGDVGFKVDNNGATSLDFITDSGVSLETLSNTVDAHGVNIADIKTNYKKVQTAVSSPSASGTAVSFIDAISQNTQGKITATKKTVRTMSGATASTDGTTGLVPAPTKGTQSNHFLRADGSWAEVAMSDTVNTTGSTNNVTNKLFIIGAKTQEESPITYSNQNVYISNHHLYSDNRQVVNISGNQALTGKTYNGYTLADACAKGVTDSSSAGAIGTGTNLVTERDVYYGLPTINNSHAYTSNTKIYAPTGAGTNGYLLKANGGTSTPTWIDPTGLRVGEAANADYADALSNTVTINGTSFQSAGANITTSKWGTARNINITDGTNSSTVVSVDGSDAVTLNLPTTIKATLDGNAGTANKLKTAVALKVGNTSKNFDGSAGLTWTHEEIGYANSSSGLLSAAAQTISGEKTFANNVNVNGTLYPKKISVEETAWINDLIIENSVEVLGTTEFCDDIRCNAGPYNKGAFGYGKSLIFFDQNGFNDKNRLGMLQCYQSSSTSASEMWMKAMKPVANSTDWTGIYVHYYADGTQKSGSNAKFYGAVWNDYAEFRQFKDGEEIPYGRIVIENGDDSLSLSTQRLQKGGNVCSDTFGFAIGETEKTKMPIAVAGRALVYTYEDRNSYVPGDAVCSGPNGTISKMTREEIREYPDCIIGYVSAIPDYEIWGEHNIIVDGRIWIKVV